jgi:hypothetical protein
MSAADLARSAGSDGEVIEMDAVGLGSRDGGHSSLMQGPFGWASVSDRGGSGGAVDAPQKAATTGRGPAGARKRTRIDPCSVLILARLRIRLAVLRRRRCACAHIPRRDCGSVTTIQSSLDRDYCLGVGSGWSGGKGGANGGEDGGVA